MRNRRGDIVHVAVDAGGHTRVLHLEHDLAAIRRQRPVDLADRRGRQRPGLETVEQLFPVRAVGVGHDLVQLLGGHVARIRAQSGENIRQLPRQEIAGVHGQDLAHFHGGAAHGGQLVRHPPGVGGGQQQIPGLQAIAGPQLPGAFSQHAAGHTPRHARDPRQAAHPRGGYGLCLSSLPSLSFATTFAAPASG